MKIFRVLFVFVIEKYAGKEIKNRHSKIRTPERDSIDLAETCGIKFNNGLGKLRSEAENFPLEIFFLRDDDIPEYVADGVADIGIVGENVLAEAARTVETIEKLGFGKCRLSLAVPKNFAYEFA